MIRKRFPDMNAGRRDAEFAATSAEVYNVTWDDVIAASGRCLQRHASCAPEKQRSRTEHSVGFHTSTRHNRDNYWPIAEHYNLPFDSWLADVEC